MRSSLVKLSIVAMIFSSFTGCRSGGSWTMPGWNYFAKGQEEAPLYKQPNKPSGSPQLPSQVALNENKPSTYSNNQAATASYNKTGTSSADKYQTGVYGSKIDNAKNSAANGIYSKNNTSSASMVQQGQYNSTYGQSNATTGQYGNTNRIASAGGGNYTPSYNSKLKTNQNPTQIDNSYVGSRNSRQPTPPATNQTTANASRYENTGASQSKAPVSNAAYSTNPDFSKSSDTRYRSEQSQQPKTNQRFTPPGIVAAGTKPTSNAAKPWRPGGTSDYPSGATQWAKNQPNASQSKYAGAKSSPTMQNTNTPAANTQQSGAIDNNYYRSRTANQGSGYPSTGTNRY